MSLFGGKMGGTTDHWDVPSADAVRAPDPDEARALLDSMRDTQPSFIDGAFLSADGRISGRPVEAVQVSRTEGHEAITATGRAICVEWCHSPIGDPGVEPEHCFYIAAGESWKGRAGLEALVRRALRSISDGDTDAE